MFPGEKVSKEDYIIVLKSRYRQLKVAAKRGVIDGTIKVDDENKKLREMRLIRSIAHILGIDAKD